MTKQGDQQRLAGRAIATIKHIARKLLDKSNLSDRYWSDAVKFAVYIHDRRPNVALDLLCPAEVFYDKPSCDNREKIIFGSKVKFTEQITQKPAIFLGYPETIEGYRVIDVTERSARIVQDVAAVNDILPNTQLNKPPFRRNESQRAHQQYIELPVPLSMIATRQAPHLGSESTEQHRDQLQNSHQQTEKINTVIQLPSDDSLPDVSTTNCSEIKKRLSEAAEPYSETVPKGSTTPIAEGRDLETAIKEKSVENPDEFYPIMQRPEFVDSNKRMDVLELIQSLSQSSEKPNDELVEIVRATEAYLKTTKDEITRFDIYSDVTRATTRANIPIGVA